MKRNALLSLVLVLAGASALAANSEKRTEYFWQPGGGMSAASAAYIYKTATFEQDYATIVSGNVAGVRGDSTAWTKNLQFDYQYGITPDWAVGVTLVTGQSDLEFTPKGGGVQSFLAGTSGLYDLLIFAKNTTPMGGWNLHYGGTINVSLGGAKLATKQNEGTNQSGGYGLAPYVGADYNLGDWGVVGASASYWWKADRNVSPQITNGTGKRKGGNELDLNAFYEYHADMWIAGLAAGMRSFEEDKTTVTDSRTGNAFGGASVSPDTKIAAHSNTYARVSGQYYIMPAAQVGLSYELEMVPDYKYDVNNSLNVYAYTNSTYMLSGRYEF